jgi:hypothetical protein
MGLRYDFLKQKPRVFRQMTTLTVEEFDTLANKLEPEWIEKTPSDRDIRTSETSGRSFF